MDKQFFTFALTSLPSANTIADVLARAQRELGTSDPTKLGFSSVERNPDFVGVHRTG